MSMIRAEVLSIGDEITSGALLDTNGQWISQRLRESGIDIAFHTTVGDDLADNIEVFRIASERVDLIIATGGLGPTADDLTRQAIAEMAQVELIRDPFELEKIVQMYRRWGREMPSNNEDQASFPDGSAVIDNPEGTAPGIDFVGTRSNGTTYRIIALPGVPAELKQMWQLSVGPAIQSEQGGNRVFHQHTIRCFGAGESRVESMLPGLVQRGRDPAVGITASSATISLRLSTHGSSLQHCLEKMLPTIRTIESHLGELVFGENDDELQGVVVNLLQSRGKTIAIADVGLEGAVAALVQGCDAAQAVYSGGDVLSASSSVQEIDIRSAARKIALDHQASIGLAIGPVDRTVETVGTGKSFYQVAIADSSGEEIKELQFIGHSSYREVKAAKEVLNYLRLYLLDSAGEAQVGGNQ